MSDYWKRFVSAAFFSEPGDTVKGVVEKLDVAVIKEVEVPKLWVRRDDGTVVTVTPTQKHLLSELVRLQPLVGDRIGIQLSGETRAAPGMNPTKIFTVFVRRRGEPGPALSPAVTLGALGQRAGLDRAGVDAALDRCIGHHSLGGASADELALAHTYFEQLAEAREAVAAEALP